jgi:hypothetical protein
MTLIKFQPIQISKIPLLIPKSNEETAEAISQTMIDLTRIAQPTHTTHLLEPTTATRGPSSTRLGSEAPQRNGKMGLGALLLKMVTSAP